MKWDKNDIINICKVVAFGIVLYWILQNLEMLGNAFSIIYTILLPFIVGAGIAFIVNIPMKLFETKIFVKKGKKSEKKSKEKIEEKVKISKPKRLLSIIISLIILLLIIIGVIFLVIPELVKVISGVIAYLPELFTNAKEIIMDLSKEYPEIEGILANIQLKLENFNAETIKELTTLGTSLVTSSFGVITSTVNFVVDLIISIIFAVYILMGKEKIVRQLKRITYAFFNEKTAAKICEIANTSRNAFTNYVTGQFTECIILGTLCAIGMVILRLPYSATVGVLVAITAFIPIVGALIGGAIGVILLLQVSLTKALTFLVFFIILQQTENNVIYPKVVGKSVGVPGILVLIAISIGGTLGGAIGMVISLPITSVLYSLFLEATNKRLNKKQINIIDN